MDSNKSNPPSSDQGASLNDESLKKMLHMIDVSMGRCPADLVLKNCEYLNVFTDEYCKGDIAISGGKIAGIGNYSGIEEYDTTGYRILPGFIDGHIHLESSLVAPSEFSMAVLPHGTTTVIIDPHEIANVMGVDGIQYMIESTTNLPIDVFIMIPSCVPATSEDESGAILDHTIIESLLTKPRVLGLAELMNYPGVVNGSVNDLLKIIIAQKHNCPIDGHAPGLNGNSLNAYVASGIRSDHECSTIEEAKEKLRLGQIIMIREGTAAHNLSSLVSLLQLPYSNHCAFCTDDKHPNDLINKGHIDYILKKSISLGADPIQAIKASSYNISKHFNLNDRGAIAPGYIADLILINDKYDVHRVYKNGTLMSENGKLINSITIPKVNEKLIDKTLNTMNLNELKKEDFQDENQKHGIIGIINNELITNDCGFASEIDVTKDILKIAVIERHHNTGHVGIGYINGYGLKVGAVATSVAHDSHNIIVVGADEKSMALAANKVRAMAGGIAVVKNDEVIAEVPLPIAGLMSNESLTEVNEKLESALEAAKKLGVNEGVAPFMTLSFMSLPVIPTLRITTSGVFDVTKQKYI
ncbi:adenine deaminase [Histomonas meleagridis]|uniref:adenine deaminase n=1 Tax=Histomonas meleagridis TaxID=135588 RepID=UPI0035598582|nr:adenine deaminase [Histomonas meleagridis]KAH0801496.1 adenine deaminase [Histomonas meleagridis]